MKAKHIVIAGRGFAGVNLAQALGGNKKLSELNQVLPSTAAILKIKFEEAIHVLANGTRF